jgi:hypothetical protein
MSTTKANLQAKINARADGGNNLISTERELWELMRDEFFSPEIKEFNGNSGNTIIGSSASGVTYTMSFKKLGNNVFVQWTITNGSGATISASTALVTITNSVYIKKTGSTPSLIAYTTAGATTHNYNSQLGTDGTVKSVTGLANGVSLIISGRYTVND